MKGVLDCLFLGATASNCFAGIDANLFVPQTSIEHRWDIGIRAHTNHLVYIGPEVFPSQDRAAIPGWHPDDLRKASAGTMRGSGVIAIVDAFHFPTALRDFNTFATRFGLPTEVSPDASAPTNKAFQVVYASGSMPTPDGGWSQEMALDIEWAHAMAPGAKIVLVEATSSSFPDLMKAVDVASSQPGVTQVSMSWGGSEFSTQAGYDRHFDHAGITYFALSGDAKGAKIFPATCANVVAVASTSFVATANPEFAAKGPFVGASASAQSETDFDPSAGIAIYDSFPSQGFVGWMVVSGSSIAGPVSAGAANASIKRG